MTRSVPFWPRLIWKCIGILSLVGAMLWCLAGAGIYGSPLTGMHGYDLLITVVYLALGPFAIYPLALLAAENPQRYGVLTIFGGALTGIMALYLIPHENMRGKLFFENTAMLLSVSLPMLMLGVWQYATTSIETPAVRGRLRGDS